MRVGQEVHLLLSIGAPFEALVPLGLLSLVEWSLSANLASAHVDDAALMSLGSCLRDLRVRKNLSLQDVADAVNASKAHIWNLEKGTSENPSMELLVGLADLFKVRVADLIGEDPSSPAEDPEMIALYRNLKQLDGRDLETIRVLTDQLRKARKAHD